MADAIISDLSAAISLAAADLFEIEQGVTPSNSSKKATLSQIQSYSQTLPFQVVSAVAGVLTLDLGFGLNRLFSVFLTSNITSIVFSNPPSAGTARNITILFRQDGTGSRTVSFPGSFNAVGSTQTAVASAPNSDTILQAASADNGTTWKYVLLGTVVGVGGLSWAITKKLADESRTATTIMTSDSALTVSLSSGTTYRIRSNVFYTIANATMDFKFQWAYSSTSSYFVTTSKNVPAGSTAGTTNETVRIDAATTSVSVLSSVAGTGVVESEIVITPTGNGTLSFQWAQNTSDAGAVVVKAGSYLEVL